MREVPRDHFGFGVRVALQSLQERPEKKNEHRLVVDARATTCVGIDPCGGNIGPASADGAGDSRCAHRATYGCASCGLHARLSRGRAATPTLPWIRPRLRGLCDDHVVLRPQLSRRRPRGAHPVCGHGRSEEEQNRTRKRNKRPTKFDHRPTESESNSCLPFIQRSSRVHGSTCTTHEQSKIAHESSFLYVLTFVYKENR